MAVDGREAGLGRDPAVICQRPWERRYAVICCDHVNQLDPSNRTVTNFSSAEDICFEQYVGNRNSILDQVESRYRSNLDGNVSIFPNGSRARIKRFARLVFRPAIIAKISQRRAQDPSAVRRGRSSRAHNLLSTHVCRLLATVLQGS